MIGNRLEQSIISVFQEDICSAYTLNQISKKLKKAYPYINKKSNYFIKEGVLNKLRVGHSYQCSLNLESEKTKMFMAMNEINKKDLLLSKLKDPLLLQESKTLPEQFSISSIILYKNILIFFCSKKIDQELLKKNSLLTSKYAFVFLDRAELKELFLKNLDFRKYYTVLYNPNAFVELISELKDDFKLLLHNATESHKADKTIMAESDIGTFGNLNKEDK
jgi:hypothetical protein